jgi:hypothetical protein
MVDLTWAQGRRTRRLAVLLVGKKIRGKLRLQTHIILLVLLEQSYYSKGQQRLVFPQRSFLEKVNKIRKIGKNWREQNSSHPRLPSRHALLPLLKGTQVFQKSGRYGCPDTADSSCYNWRKGGGWFGKPLLTQQGSNCLVVCSLGKAVGKRGAGELPTVEGTGLYWV